MIVGPMQIEATTFPAHEPNQNILHRAYFAEQISLALAVQFVVANLLSRLFPVVDNLLPAGLLHMRVFPALAVLSATLALFFTEGGRYRNLYRAGRFLVGLTTSAAAITFWAPAAHVLAYFDHSLNRGQIPQSQDPLHAVSFALVLLGVRSKLGLR